MLLNGRQVIDQVSSAALADLVEVGDIPRPHGRCRLFTGAGVGVRWIGWSTNLQSNWGVSHAFTSDLVHWIADVVTPDAGNGIDWDGTPGADLDEQGHLAQGRLVSGKRQLTELLQEWLRHSSAPTVGDVGAFGGRPWLRIEVGGHRVVLNADTKRAAVEAFVRGSAPDPEQPWRVVANARGRVNKVLPNPGADPVPGWYAYLTQPLPAPGSM